MTLEERGIKPSERASMSKQERQGLGADWDNATSQFPSVKQGEAEWVAFFDRRPDVMYTILGDIYREVKAQEAREDGSAKTGRRPKAINGNLDELHAMITPRYSMEPFAEAVKDLQGDRSLRAFAAKCGMHHHTLTRLMRGELPLDKFRMEAIAAAGKVSPAFFMEWRLLFVQEAVEALFRAKPNLSIRATRQIQQARR